MYRHRIGRLFLLLAAILLGATTRAEDIDIFTGTTEVNVGLPNVIFMLDNTSNWSRKSQGWPGGVVQGQSEVSAIKTALAAQVGNLNVGVMEYVTGGNAEDTNAGYVRFNLQELTGDSYDNLSEILDTIYGDINGPTEKRSSSNPYGDLPWDFYNYLSSGNHSNDGDGTPTGTAPMAGGDPAAYTTKWSKFNSPLGALDACANTFLIFIGNNVQGSIASDDVTNSNALRAAYQAAGASADLKQALAGDSGAPLPIPEFSCTESPGPDIIIEEGYTETIVHPAQPGKTLGTSAACWKSTEKAQCTAAEQSGLCASVAGITSCSCTAISSNRAGCKTNGSAANQTWHWTVVGDVPGYTQVIEHPPVTEPGPPITQCTETNQPNTTGGLALNFDDWAKFLYEEGIPLTVSVGDETYNERVEVVTYTIDVFKDQQSADLSGVWYNAAKVGGGKYFQAKSEDQILAAINNAFDEILSVSSSFSAVSLPLSTTNRARVDNQVYIGMFRPAEKKAPRWFGNLKRYQLALFNGEPELADVKLESAISSQTGFAKNCAESFWNEDSGSFWETLQVLNNPDFNKQFCSDATKWNDLPDGPFVEKGGLAQQTRQLADSDARTLYTVQDDTNLRELADADATALGGDSVMDYLRGDAAGADGEVMPGSGLRASIHGDVVHSRPLSIRYAEDEIRIYYGSNDGMFRAADPEDGSEQWGLIVPEHFSKVQRLYNNSPLIKYTGTEEPGEVLKDYFFDGSTGQITTYNDDGTIEAAYIYPTMRRGGRMVYALDVSDPDDPDLLWRVGCPNLANNTDCTTGFTGIGQTWSTPIGAYLQSYTDNDDNAQAVVMFGGGFDNCLNADSAPYPAACSSANGKGVYILNATTGQLLRQFDTDAPVITDLAPVDINFDGYIDFAYAADVAGNLYRINFGTMESSDPASELTALVVNDWTIYKVAAMSDNTRRFYNAPVVGAFQGRVVVTIGTGDRERPLEINYPFTAEVQNRFYAFFDEPYKTFVANPVGNLDPDEATTTDLDGATMLAVVPADNGSEPSTFTLEYDGWYMDLSDRGEQVANPAAIGGGKAFFNTFQPGGTQEGLCTRPLGIGTGYAVNLFGPEYTQGTEIEGPGIPIPPVISSVGLTSSDDYPKCLGPDCRYDCGSGICSCEGTDCPPPPTIPPKLVFTDICIGCQGFIPVEIIPDPDPERRRVFFTEDIDRN